MQCLLMQLACVRRRCVTVEVWGRQPVRQAAVSGTPYNTCGGGRKTTSCGISSQTAVCCGLSCRATLHRETLCHGTTSSAAVGSSPSSQPLTVQVRRFSRFLLTEVASCLPSSHARAASCGLLPVLAMTSAPVACWPGRASWGRRGRNRCPSKHQDSEGAGTQAARPHPLRSSRPRPALLLSLLSSSFFFKELLCLNADFATDFF